MIGNRFVSNLQITSSVAREIAAMRWEHVDRKTKVLLIPEAKNGTPRRTLQQTGNRCVTTH